MVVYSYGTDCVVWTLMAWGEGVDNTSSCLSNLNMNNRKKNNERFKNYFGLKIINHKHNQD